MSQGNVRGQIERLKIVDDETNTIKELLNELSSTFLRIYEQFNEKQLNESLFNSRNSNLQKMAKLNSMLSNDKIFGDIMMHINKECAFNCKNF